MELKEVEQRAQLLGHSHGRAEVAPLDCSALVDETVPSGEFRGKVRASVIFRTVEFLRCLDNNWFGTASARILPLRRCAV